MSIKRYKSEIKNMVGYQMTCLSSDVSKLEEENKNLAHSNQTLEERCKDLKDAIAARDDVIRCAKERIEELQAESMQLKFQLWGRGIIDDPGPKDPDTVDMFT